MKRIFSLICAAALMLSALPGVTVSAKTAGEKPQITLDDNPDLVAGVFSDSHITEEGMTGKLKTALSWYKDVLGNDGYMVLAGDIIYQNQDVTVNADAKNNEERYNLFTKIYNEYGFTYQNSVYAMGNHEFVQNARGEKYADLSAASKEMFTEKTGLATNHTKTFNGYTFISASPESYANDMSQTTEEWVLSEIEKAEKESENKPIFYIQHQPIYGTVTGSTIGQINSDDFLEKLAKHPRVIVISAHIHAAIQDPRNIWQGSYTVIGSSLLSGGGLYYQGCKDEGNIYDVSNGMLLEVKGSVAKFHKINFFDGQEVGEPYTIDVANSNSWHYTESYRNENAKAPTFPSDAKVSVSDVSGHSAKVTFPLSANMTESAADMQDGFVHSYKVDVYNVEAGNLLKSFNLLAPFMKPNWSATEKNTTIDGLDRNTKYRVEIAPLSPYQKAGNAIVTEFTTTKDKDDIDYSYTFQKEINVALNKPVTSTLTQHTDFPVSNLTDGRSSAAVRGTGDISDEGKYIQIDLLKRYNVKSVKIWDRLDVDQEHGRVAFDIQASNDANFGSYVTLGGNNDANAFKHGTPFEIKVGNTKPYRYIRLVRKNNGYWAYSEIQVFADVDVTEISRYKAVDTNTQYADANFDVTKAVDGNTASTWVGDYSKGGEYSYLRIDTEKSRHIGLVELETRKGNKEPNLMHGWSVYGGNEKTEISTSDNVLNGTYTRLYATGYNGNNYIEGLSPFTPVLEGQTGKLSVPLKDTQGYRYIVFRNSENGNHFTPEVGEVRAFELNPMVNSISKTGKKITVDFSDKMADITAEDISITAMSGQMVSVSDVALSADRYTLTFNVTEGFNAGSITISDKITNEYGIDMANPYVYTVENTSTDYSNKKAVTFNKVNVAINKPVEVYKEQSDVNYTKANLVDGIVSPATSSGMVYTAGSPKDEYYTIDLERRYNIDSIEIWGNYSVSGQDGAYKYFNVTASADGVKWDTLAVENAYSAEKWTQRDGKPECYTINLPTDNNYRYVKWQKTDSSWYRLSEIKVFADVNAMKVSEKSDAIIGGGDNSYGIGIANLTDENTGNFVYATGTYPWATMTLDNEYPVDMVQIYRRGFGKAEYGDGKASNIGRGLFGSNSISSENTDSYSYDDMGKLGYTELMNTGKYYNYNNALGNTGTYGWVFDDADGYLKTFKNDTAYKYLTLKKMTGENHNLQYAEFAAYVMNPALNKAELNENTITLHFSDPMSKFLLDKNLTLENVFGDAVTIVNTELSSDGYDYIITIDANETMYKVKISAGARSVKGAVMRETEKYVGQGIAVASYTIFDADGKEVTAYLPNTEYTVKAVVVSTMSTDENVSLYAAMHKSGELLNVSCKNADVPAHGSCEITAKINTGAEGDFNIYVWETGTQKPLNRVKTIPKNN